MAEGRDVCDVLLGKSHESSQGKEDYVVWMK